jgi:hypothetical protein
MRHSEVRPGYPLRARDGRPERELEKFRPETTVIALFIAITNYGLVYKQRTLPMTLYYGWFLSRFPSFALSPLSDQIEMWKGLFGNPEGKLLAHALAPLREMISLSRKVFDDVVKRLPPEAVKNIER